ncbi:MAG: hypothetical protein PWQ12_1210 [Clostridiales bacterium]|jgi:hypothetical protein|nr:hypothetical protein [Clostridiales bacterium]
MRTFGFFLGHPRGLAHAEALIRSISVSEPEAAVMAIVPDEMPEEKVYLEKVFEKMHQAGIFSVECVGGTTDYLEYPFTDKLMGAARFENACNGESIWLDVDSLVLQKLPNFKTGHFYVNPVDKKNVGIPFGNAMPQTGKMKPGQGKSALWQEAEGYFGFKCSEFDAVETRVTREAIYPYFNVGCVVNGTGVPIFKKAVAALVEIIALKKRFPSVQESFLEKVFLHQVMFTGAVLSAFSQVGVADIYASNGKVKRLPKGVNYPIHLLKEDGHKPNPETLYSIRYDTYFDDNSWPESLPEIPDVSAEALKSFWYYQ